MIRQLPLLAILGLNLTFAAWPQSVPIYSVTVVERTVRAVNYQYRTGPTPIDFRGTVLLPESKGDAMVESKAGRTEIDAHFSHLPAPARFGPEYLTYVVWAITPEGHPKNLGEIIPGSSDKAKTHVTTDLQAFGLIVTAEPYAAVRQPSDVVVMENETRPETIGATEPIQVRYELMPRHGYTYNKPADLKTVETGPTVSMGEYETLLELYQARNAVQIAQASGAGQYAPDVLGKAQTQLQSAQALHNRKVDKSLVIAAAREAAQTAEDARLLGDGRAKDAEIANARGAAEKERQLRVAAEAQAEQARQQAVQAQRRAAQAQAESQAAQAQAAEAQAQAAESRAAAGSRASADRMQLEQPRPAQTTPPVAAPPADFSTVHPPAPDERPQRELRAALAQRINGYFPSRDTPRGLVATVSSFAFRGAALDSQAMDSTAQIAALVAAHPGLTVEVEAHSDSAAPEAERLAGVRAEAVREALVRGGIPQAAVGVRALGNSRPIGPNTTAQSREANRRIEIVISGGPIGNAAVWDKSYSLGPRN
jgi:outer membrane protein OmpA-like peptidoglycan-associated protein